MTTYQVPTTARQPRPVAASARRRIPVPTRWLLDAAAMTGPAFFTLVIAQMLTREGYDLRVHPISQLATGGPGWVQMLNFVLAGCGALALAIALRRRLTEGLGRRAVPVLVGIFGLGLILSGLFPMDPQHGFPVGTPDGPAPAMSWHSMIHSGAAAVAFSALAIACLVGVVRCLRRRQAAAALGHGIVALVLLIPVSPTGASIQIAVTGVVAFTWTTVYALRLRSAAAA